MDAMVTMMTVRPTMVPAMMELDLPGALYRYRSADIDPVVKPLGWIATRERHSNATVGGGPVGNRGEAVNEHIPIDLHAKGHRRPVVESGKVHALFRGPGAEGPVRGSMPFPARAYPGAQDQSGALVGSNLLL